MTDEERFWSKVLCNLETGCWLWVGTILNHGYGQFWDGNGRVVAHRFSLGLVETLDPELFVCHRCNTPLCVRWDHLYQGTHQDNMNDMKEATRTNLLDRAIKLAEQSLATAFETKIQWPRHSVRTKLEE